MPLDSYSYFTLEICLTESFSEYINRVNNLGRLAVIGSRINFSVKLRVKIHSTQDII